MINQEQKVDKKPTAKWMRYLKSIGLVGFLFFLIKGLVWLFVLLFIKSKL